MKSILTKITMGLLCASLALPATAAIERAPKAPSATTTETTTSHALAASSSAASAWSRAKITRAQKREARKAFRDMMRAGADTNKVLLVILAILIPPLAVALHQGEINSKFWISLLLTILFWVPGVIYSILVVTDSI